MSDTKSEIDRLRADHKKREELWNKKKEKSAPQKRRCAYKMWDGNQCHLCYDNQDTAFCNIHGGEGHTPDNLIDAVEGGFIR